ncbi:hypothetical protein ACFLQI_01785, partial [Candidatus Undinarchaeota archaeon]
MQIPEWYSKRCKEIMEDSEEYLASLGKRVPQAIRVTDQIEPEELKRRLEEKYFVLEPVPYLEKSFIIKNSKFSIGAMQEYLLGHYYIQSIGPQIPIHLMPDGGKLGIDLCAAESLLRARFL